MTDDTRERREKAFDNSFTFSAGLAWLREAIVSEMEISCRFGWRRSGSVNNQYVHELPAARLRTAHVEQENDFLLGFSWLKSRECRRLSDPCRFPRTDCEDIAVKEGNSIKNASKQLLRCRLRRIRTAVMNGKGTQPIWGTFEQATVSTISTVSRWPRAKDSQCFVKPFQCYALESLPSSSICKGPKHRSCLRFSWWYRRGNV